MSARSTVHTSTLEPPRPTWLEIDVEAITQNTRRLRATIGRACLLAAVVKANAYGHDVRLVAQACLAGGADRFAVATLQEAVELRGLGITAPIHILGYTPPRQATEVVAADVIPTLYDAETADALAHAARATGLRLPVHVKINTGMNRLGILPHAAPDLLRTLQRRPELLVEGIFTHFATADTDLAFAAQQFERFSRLLVELDQAGLRPPIAHAANSAATLTMPAAHLQMVRCGIALYGLHPDAESARLPEGFRPALSWKAEIAHVFRLQAGDAVSYGREFVAQSPGLAAVIPVGYADGFPRRPQHWQHVLVHGCPAPILGRVCMDQTVIDVTAAADAQPVRAGDEAVLIGGPTDAVRYGNAQISADEVAARLGTINYDVVSRILARVPRIPVGRMADHNPNTEQD